MRRAPIVLTATVAGLAGVLSFDARAPVLPAAVARSPASATSRPAASRPASGTTAERYTGDAVDTRYGAAQVRVTIAAGRITNVEALRLQAGERKSLEISSAAEPQLRASALAKQSAAVDAVSGATFTSTSYEASLQSALDKAGFVAADGTRGS